MRRVLVLVLSLSLSSAWGEVYKWVDGDGIVHYSDEPEAGARPIALPEISIYKFRVPEARPAPPVADKPPSVPAVEDYRSFAIVRPGNNDSFNRVPPRLEVIFDLDPELQSGHAIELSVDGKATGAVIRGGATIISGFTAGSHILSARILASDGRQLARTKSVLFHYQPSESTSSDDWAPAFDAPPAPGDLP